MANGLTGWLRHTDGHPAVLYVGMSCSAAAYRLTWTSRTWPHRDAGRRNRSAAAPGEATSARRCRRKRPARAGTCAPTLVSDARAVPQRPELAQKLLVSV
ncbi:hypothetical protein AcV5_006102 [Taiwanofungus camphoratus]|nr:hypothetical protein AcV5_006102 [Antrodia cinnamomea]